MGAGDAGEGRIPSKSHTPFLPVFPPSHARAPSISRTLRRPSLALLRTALTLRSAGEGSDYETLETLGDTFMKYAVCAELFFENRTYHEGQLTRCKDDVVSNLSLAQRAQALGLHSALQVLPFSMGNWTAPPIVKVWRGVVWWG